MADRETGKFIVIEGIDGAGTTTQSHLLVDRLNGMGRRALFTCEPSRGPIGTMLRQVLTGRVVGVSNDAIALLFAADRLDHLDAEILPQLAEGVQVVSDRYYHSSLTYQALQTDLAWIRALNARARAPDLTFLLDVPAHQAAARRLRVRAGEELYERDAVQERLELAYRQLPAMLPSEAMVVLDGRQDIQTVHRQIFEELVRRFGWG